MPGFQSRPWRTYKLNQIVNKNPLVFGVPFVLIMVAASYALTPFAQTRYDLHDQRVKHMTKEQELGLDKDRKKYDIREEYFRLSATSDEEWEPIRIKRPKGVPEWGVPPPSKS